eukprot:6826249-Prymnesium_polylepis.1
MERLSRMRNVTSSRELARARLSRGASVRPRRGFCVAPLTGVPRGKPTDALLAHPPTHAYAVL